MLQARLIRLVQNRISNGEFTERGLARALQVSQPHMHNVLKGLRKLSPELADQLLLHFGITVADLFEPGEIEAAAHREDAIALGRPSSIVRDFRQEQMELLSSEDPKPQKGQSSERAPYKPTFTKTA